MEVQPPLSSYDRERERLACMWGIDVERVTDEDVLASLCPKDEWPPPVKVWIRPGGHGTPSGRDDDPGF